MMRSYALGGLILLGLSSSLRAGPLGALAKTPDWSTLQPYQKTITHDEFARLVNSIYSPDGGFWTLATLHGDGVDVFSGPDKKQVVFSLKFAPNDSACVSLPYHYATRSASTDPARPLKGIKIALDPGHIGGDWAQLEARYFKIGNDPSVEEAKLNLITCTILADRLTADGADVVWAKRGYDPVTSERPDTLRAEAIAQLAISGHAPSSSSPRGPTLFGLPVGAPSYRGGSEVVERRINNEAALLFYRVAEIRARAAAVNKLHPDLTICVHYNADDWGNPDNPTLVANSRLVIFINGSYEKSELDQDDVRYDMLRKLLDRDADQEERGCELVGQSMLDTLKYPPEKYTGYFARQVTRVPSVYARNLLANRLYHGPVVYCEGPYMNARDAYYRIIAGDYLGQKVIQGQSVPSVYRQYADAVERGVLKYFGK